MARTLADFYVDVLSELGVVGIDRSATAEDRAVIERIYDSVYDMLEHRELVDWAKEGSIPDGAVVPVKTITAFYASNEFEVPADKYIKLEAKGELGAADNKWAERELRKRLGSPYISSTLPTRYY